MRFGVFKKKKKLFVDGGKSLFDFSLEKNLIFSTGRLSAKKAKKKLGLLSLFGRFLFFF